MQKKMNKCRFFSSLSSGYSGQGSATPERASSGQGSSTLERASSGQGSSTPERASSGQGSSTPERASSGQGSSTPERASSGQGAALIDGIPEKDLKSENLNQNNEVSYCLLSVKSKKI